MNKDKPIKITLAKALKLKNKLIHEINKLKNKLSEENSMLEDNWKENSQDLFLKEIEELKLKTSKLVELKSLISKANIKILNKIYGLSELKSYISWISNIDSRDGLCESNSFSGGNVNEYKACLTKQTIHEAVNKAEEKIEILQDEVDIFNNSKRIKWEY